MPLSVCLVCEHPQHDRLPLNGTLSQWQSLSLFQLVVLQTIERAGNVLHLYLHCIFAAQSSCIFVSKMDGKLSSLASVSSVKKRVSPLHLRAYLEVLPRTWPMQKARVRRCLFFSSIFVKLEKTVRNPNNRHSVSLTCFFMHRAKETLTSEQDSEMAEVWQDVSCRQNCRMSGLACYCGQWPDADVTQQEREREIEKEDIVPQARLL